MKETEKKDKTIRKTDEKAGGHLVLFVRRNAVYIAVFLIGSAFLLVVLFMVQAIYHGFPPVIVSTLTILTAFYCTWSCSNRNYFLHKFKNLTSYRILQDLLMAQVKVLNL